jgi:hypothetical protein
VFLCASVSIVGICLAAASAAAQRGRVDVPPASRAPAGRESVQRGVQGPEGLLHGRLLLHINTSSDRFGEPVSLAPDLHYSFTDTFQAGIVHNLPMGWLTRPGAGICLSGKEDGCPVVYSNVGLDTMVGLSFGDVHFSLHTGLYALHVFNPVTQSARWRFMLALGLTGKLHLGDSVALFFDPAVGVALDERDAGHEDLLFVPADLQFQVGDRVALKLLSGVTGVLSDLGETYEIPLGLGLVGNLSTTFDLGLRFSFDNLLGKQPAGVDRIDTRSVAVLLNVRFN